LHINHNFVDLGAKIKSMTREAEGLKMPRGDKSLMEEYSVIFPSKIEQQKIADCLTSLDEQIEAQSQKIAALKLHKKGLRQQLFPSINETL
jgi:type I restriction enzyme, S subunit